MISVRPLMVCISTSSATLKAASTGSFGTSSRSLSFGTTMVVSQTCAQLVQSGQGVLHADRSLGLERQGDDADGQRPDLFLGDAGDVVGRAGSGAAAHARGDEDDVAPLRKSLISHVVLAGGLLSDLWPGASAQTAGLGLADEDLLRGADGQQVLGVGVDGAELCAADAGIDAAVDGVAAAAAASDDLDADIQLSGDPEQFLVRCAHDRRGAGGVEPAGPGCLLVSHTSICWLLNSSVS